MGFTLVILVAFSGKADIWIGLRYDNGNWSFADKSLVDFFHFENRDALSNSSGCVALTKNGFWTFLNCSQHLSFLCEKGPGKTNSMDTKIFKPTYTKSEMFDQLF